VTQINSIHENAVTQTGQRSSAKPAGDFRGSLETALVRNSEGTAEGGRAAALGEPQAAHFNSVVTSATNDIAGQTDSLLDLLESYAEGLENPGTTLKDLAPLLDRIRDGAQELMSSTDSDTSADDELRALATQTALTANIEYLKFQRGDYL